MTHPRIFTKPHVPKNANSCDNVNGDLIVACDDIFDDGKGHKYQVKDRIGSGQFGQVFHVVEISNPENPQNFALKITKSIPVFQTQAQKEVKLLLHAQTNLLPNESQRISHLYDCFTYQGHYCVVLELLSFDLYKVLKVRNFIGLDFFLIQYVVRDALTALYGFRRINVIHCDLKPENIVLQDLYSKNIKLIDLGSAILSNETNNYNIQTIYYRAPEVALHLPYSYPIDIWSLGCVAFELFTALPLFPALSEIQLLNYYTDFLGPIPNEMIDSSNRKNKYFNEDGSLKSEEQYYQENHLQNNVRTRYFVVHSIDDIILTYRFPENANEQQRAVELERRRLFCDFLKAALQYDPLTRITPEQALQHPFVTTNMDR